MIQKAWRQYKLRKTTRLSKKKKKKIKRFPPKSPLAQFEALPELKKLFLKQKIAKDCGFKPLPGGRSWLFDRMLEKYTSCKITFLKKHFSSKKK